MFKFKKFQISGKFQEIALDEGYPDEIERICSWVAKLLTFQQGGSDETSLQIEDFFEWKKILS